MYRDLTHYFFKNHDNIRNLVNFLPGLDIRSDSGYIIAAPSNHFHGTEYVWEVANHIADIPIVTAPDWLLKILSTLTPITHGKKSRTYWSQLIKGVSEGNRNNSAVSLAGYLFRHYVEVELIGAIIEMWNERNNPPLPSKELEKIVVYVARKERQRRVKCGE